MTQDSTFQRPSLFIGGKEIFDKISGSISFSGNNQLNSLSVSISNPDLQHDSLFNHHIKLFLNHNDNVPIFRGYIKDVTPNKDGLSIKAVDVRTKISGKDGMKLTLTDSENYDGYTLSQFLFSVLKDESIIGVDMLKDTNPPIYLTGVRGSNLSVYEIVTSKIKESIDVETDFFHPLEHFIDVYEGANETHITFKKDKLLSEAPLYYFSYTDGLKDYSFKRRLPPNTANYEGGQFKYTSRPTGQISLDIEKKESPAVTRNLALQNILIQQQETDEISIEVTKDYDISIGSLVFLDVDDEDIKGNHRVKSKNISFGNTMSCRIQLNKSPPAITDYIQRE